MTVELPGAGVAGALPRIDGFRRRGAALLTVAALAAGLVGAVPPTMARAASLTAATPTEDGLWYYDVPGFEEIHASGTRGEGVTIAVLDGPINPDVPDLAGTPLTVRTDSTCPDGAGGYLPAVSTGPDAYHAPNIVALILGTGAGAAGEPGVRGVAPAAGVHHWAVITGDPDNARVDECETSTSVADGIALALEAGADIISMSFAESYDPTTEDAIADALRAGVIVVAGTAPDDSYPASFNGVVTVEAADQSGGLGPAVGDLADVLAPGVDIRTITRTEEGTWDAYTLTTGSSHATAWTAGVMALVWSAHADATSNQIIQTLVRHTAGADGQLRDPDPSTGYGFVSVSAMLAADPTTYPDTNPLLTPGHPFGPDIEEILGGPSETTTPSPTLQPTPTPEDPTGGNDAGAGTADERDSGSRLLPVIGAVGVLLLVMFLFLVRHRRSAARSRRRSAAPVREDDR